MTLWGLAAVAVLLALAFATQSLGIPVVAAASDFVESGARARAALAIDALAARSAPLAAACALAAGFAVGGAAALRRGRVGLALLGYAATGVALMVATQHWILPAVATANTRRGAAITELTAGRRGLVAAPGYDYATAFYRGGMPVYAGSLIAGPRRLLIRRDVWRGLDWRLRALYQPVPGMDLAKQNNQVSYLLVERVAGSAVGADARLDFNK